MRKSRATLTVTGAGLALLLVAQGAFARPGLPAPEYGLLGIHLNSTFQQVLHKFGQPGEIQAGQPQLPSQGQPTVQTTNTGVGAPGFGVGPPTAGGGMFGMTKPMGGTMGSLGAGGPRGGMGAAGGLSGPMTRPGGLGGLSGPMGMPAGGAKGGLPGFLGAGGGGAPFGGAPGPGGMGMNPGVTIGSATGVESAVTTWWYHFVRQGRHYSFLFNSNGRVVQIQEYGWTGGGKTRQGVGLGSSLGLVLKKYGWSGDGVRDGSRLTLPYGGNTVLVFQLVNNKVVGITLAKVN